MSKPKLVNAAELARASHYSPPTISKWTGLGVIKRSDGLYDLGASLIAIREHEKARASDGGRDRGELSQLRGEKLKRQIKLLDVEIRKAERDQPGGMIPVAELRRLVSLLVCGLRISLNSQGESVASDGLIAAVLPILSNDQDRWLHDQIRADVWGWIGQSEKHIERALALYAVALDALRGGDVSDEDAPALSRIIQRVLDKTKDLPPILSKEEYEKQAFAECMARGRKEGAR